MRLACEIRYCSDCYYEAMAAANGGGGGEKGRGSPGDEDWERRLMTGDLPEDFLKVTEPRTSPPQTTTTPPTAAGGDNNKRMAATNQAFEPEVGNLVDVPSSPSRGTAAAAASATASRNTAKKSSSSSSETSPQKVSGGEKERRKQV